MGKMTLTNRGPGPLRVPGTEDVEHCYELPEEDRFTHGLAEWRQIPSITKKELLMLRVMGAFTDRSSWVKDIFDSIVVAEWKAQLFATEPLMSTAIMDWCIRELQDKARDSVDSGIVNVLDIGASCCKADSLIDSKLCRGLVASISDLEQIEQEQPLQKGLGRHIIVNPNASALQFGKTHVLELPEVVDLGDLDHTEYRTMRTLPGPHSNHDESSHLSGDVPDQPSLWKCWDLFSQRYQWLPFEISFTDEAKVEVTSYINGVHPIPFKDFYMLIGRCATTSIGLWNRVLQKFGNFNGRCPPRIKTYGVEWWQTGRQYKDLVNLFGGHPRIRYHSQAQRDDLQDWAHNTLFSGSDAPPDFNLSSLPDLAGKEDVYRDSYLSHPWSGVLPAAPATSRSESVYELEQALKTKWRTSRRWRHPEPGIRYNYEEWRSGTNLNPIVASDSSDRKNLPSIAPASHFEYYTIDLAEQFREQGLQVYLEVVSVSLSPEQDSVPSTEYVFAGTLNEHIAATSVICFEMENIKVGAGVDFRHAVENSGVLQEETCYHYHDIELQEVFDLPDLHVVGDGAYDEIPSLQYRGSIDFQEGRIFAWPNTLQYRFRDVSLADPSVGGSLSYVLLYLVDPKYRICSTLNVPPPQSIRSAKERTPELISRKSEGLFKSVTGGFRDFLPQSQDEAVIEDVVEEKAELQKGAEKHTGFYESSYAHDFL